MTQHIASIAPLSLADEGALRSLRLLQERAQAEDLPTGPPPCPTAFLGQMLHPRPGTSVLTWGLWSRGLPVGLCAIGVRKNGTRPTAEVIHFLVHPDVRRTGLGRRLLAAATHQLAGVGVRKLAVFTSGPTGEASPGDAFAQATGAACVQRYLGLSLRTGPTRQPLDVDPAYELLHWRDGVPSEHEAAFAEMSSRLAAEEAARAGGDQAPEIFDADKIHRLYAALRAWGYRTYLTAVRHRATGLLVGYSALGMADAHQRHASQWDTIVLPSHRGRRLGGVLKRANLSWTAEHEPALATVETWNAASNAGMLHVNQSFGFRADRSGALREWPL